MSLEEWTALEKQEPGELVDGELVEEEMPTWAHEVVVGWLIELLRQWVVPLGGAVAGSEWKLAVSERRGRKPDVVVYLPGAPRPRRRDRVGHTPPSIVVEVVTDTPRDAKRDRVDKPDEYAQFNVPYYWVLDPERRTVEIFERGDDGRYVRALAASDGIASRIPGCEGLVVDLDALWSEVDRAAAEETE
jgi:Uma2 family endonuclease